MDKQAMTFKEFVMSQPTDREIDHGDWSSCAVGDYAREVLNVTLVFNEFEPNMVEEMVADGATAIKKQYQHESQSGWQ